MNVSTFKTQGAGVSMFFCLAMLFHGAVIGESFRDDSKPPARVTGQGAVKTEKQEELTPMQKELKRRLQVMQWAQKTKPSQKDYIAKIYEPVIEGNKREYPFNLKAAEHYRLMAEEAAKKENAEKTVEKYTRIAKAFTDLAALNRSIVSAIAAVDDAALEKAFADYKKLEDLIANYVTKPPKREWFMPSDFRTVTTAAVATATGEKSGTGKDTAPATKPAAGTAEL